MKPTSEVSSFQAVAYGLAATLALLFANSSFASPGILEATGGRAPYVDSGINNQAMTWIGSATTQGDGVMNAPAARSTFNVNGAGIKIGIISDSFNSLGTMN